VLRKRMPGARCACDLTHRGRNRWNILECSHVNRHAAWSIHTVLFGPSGPCLRAAATKIADIQRIIAQRNRIVHGYDAVDDLLVWDAVENHLPTLLTESRALAVDPILKSDGVRSWDPLRAEVCFEKIVASLAPKEN